MNGFTKFCARFGRFAGLLALVVIILATLGYGVGVLPLRPALFGVLGALISGVLAVMTGLVATLFGAQYSQRRRRMGVMAMVFGVLAAAVPAYWMVQSRGVPMIHDISTDTVDPPAFVAVAKLRSEDDNPAAYTGVEVAREQSVAYPDIKTIQYEGTPDQAFDAALGVAQAMGWEIHAQDASTGTIEATETTTFFRFKDDVVVRVRSAGDGSQIDIRSKSRTGLSDLGVNAKRIRQFRDRVLAAR